MKTFTMTTGDVNFIALVNPASYRSFVNENWDLPMLKVHWDNEGAKDTIMVFQMTEEGMQEDWRIRVQNEGAKPEQFFRNTEGRIRVDSGQLCFVEYDCLTMAAQFEDSRVPNRECEKYCFELENGLYKVEVFQFLDVDTDDRMGPEDMDILFILSKAEDMVPENMAGAYWYTC